MRFSFWGNRLWFYPPMNRRLNVLFRGYTRTEREKSHLETLTRNLEVVDEGRKVSVDNFIDVNQ